MRTIMVINQKEGVRKATTALHAHALALNKISVTVIDPNSQGHLTVSRGLDSALKHAYSIEDCIK